MFTVKEVASGELVGWGDVRPILILLFFALTLGLFAFGAMMREYAWLNQWNDEPEDYEDLDIEYASSQ